MTEEELKAIEERVATTPKVGYLISYAVDDLAAMVSELHGDVVALITEVRRLRALAGSEEVTTPRG